MRLCVLIRSVQIEVGVARTCSALRSGRAKKWGASEAALRRAKHMHNIWGNSAFALISAGRKDFYTLWRASEGLSCNVISGQLHLLFIECKLLSTDLNPIKTAPARQRHAHICSAATTCSKLSAKSRTTHVNWFKRRQSQCHARIWRNNARDKQTLGEN
jgi:hypothetical protein